MNRAGLVQPWGVLWRWLLPWRCLLCDAPGMSGVDLCHACAAELPRNRHCCRRCALPLPMSAPVCGRCQRRPPPWNTAWVPFLYSWPLDRLAARYKFAAALSAGRALTALWCAQSMPPDRPTLIVPVPLHWARLRQRGYNQALELARPLARAWGIQCRHDILRRIRATETQTELDAVARNRNVTNAFAVRMGCLLPAHVVVLDDVMTTGATLAECTRVLKRAGVARVDVWALARAPL